MSLPRSNPRRSAAVLSSRAFALAMAMAATFAEAEPATPRPVTTTTATTMSVTPAGAAASPASAATATGTTPVARRRPDPLDPAALVPAAAHGALLPTTGPADDPAVADWRDANDVVARTGGWRALARGTEEGAPR